MKHFTIQLVDAGRQTRQWSIWANTLTVGSDPRSKLVLPAPAARLVGAFRSDAAIELPFGQLLVTEDTPFQSHLWEKARDRIAKSRLLGWNEPGEKGKNARAAVLAGFGALFFFATGAMYLCRGPVRPADVGDLPSYIVDLVPEDKVVDPPKPVEPDPVVVPESGADQPIADPNQGGPTEARTVAQPPNSPAGVMAGSVLARANTDMGDLLGNQVDPNVSNMIDVIVAGPGGLRGSNQNGRAGDGDNRMVGIGGAGLGSGGRAGFGTGRGSIAGTMRAGLNSHGDDHGVALRPTISAPRPTDVELGGEVGSRSPESILRVIRTNIGGFRYSYEKVLRENPDVGGKIAMRFTIAPSGDIVAIEIVSSSTGVDALDAEIKEKARRMKFDSIEKGNVTVTYAFVLDRQ